VARNTGRRNSLSLAGDDEDKKSFEAWSVPGRMEAFDEK
jgi:hypothetical protein